ncbi:DUF1266 domain-containing protein [Streptomyces noursei]|uniref:DUF1266 domain-containing protein n=1 Tax=Streptomyces noursei TaxID=1971 RepID=UPI00196648B5|nr:DUF1266 domain-containing protein [Streptomyces noursei]QRX93449.1 DUF1266 domain-containing protein [Streptomyces noursei]
MNARILAGALLKMVFGPSAKRRYRVPLTAHQQWMVSLDAVLAERMWGHSHLMLYPLKRINSTNCRVSLQQSWDITSPESLHSTLHWLASEGHRRQMASVIGHPPVAWDFGRYVTVTRLAFGAGYIDEAGAWQLLANAVAPVAQTYSSWQAFAHDFVTARELWMRNAGNEWSGSHEGTVQAVHRLLDPTNTSSPWQQIPWETIYHSDHMPA